MKNITLKQHLDLIRKKSHETQKKNGHMKRMSEKAKEYWAKKRK